ncbi:Lrp/AsnC family transcriptional regulator [Streptomyces sp. H10-C2]|uniref:Lrp/AsnC family transcriptional regulator n=1 Tax=unclassified Streptomyces TaxID=2593676 RepID=UPI0024B97FD7|nr:MULTISPECIES: Lrp/AsnC family transcriptional regulator [unclassified Streptomyces]MDJ0344315.1 Lrp/AsnC family transcriptional regulator [Streptomyces sp. PH10-H1]MDJ0373684.1 Lrp/AsnC family transcriptional regulator [Streptomyces sp. H10-C2]
MESPSFDELDHKLIQALQLDGRAPFSRIAAAFGVSDQTIARRYRRLRADGGLRVLGLADADRLGRTRWLLRLRCAPDAAEPIAKALARRPDTKWIGLTSGGTELVCIAEPRTEDDQAALMLGKLPRTPRILEISALCLLHTFYGGRLGWFAKGDGMSPAEVEALAPPPVDPFTGTIGLDAEDEALIDALSRDGRATYPELQQATGLSESAAKRRLEQLRRTGALFIDIQFDAVQLGYRAHVVLWLTVRPSALSTVGQALADHAEIAFACATTGSSNLFAVVLCRDTAHLYRYLSEKIGALDGVQHVETAPSVRRVKHLAYEERRR